MSSDVHCYKCNAVIDLPAQTRPGREEECFTCGVSLHCCMMCLFHDKSAYNECREPVAQRIVNKEKSNFCDFMKLKGGGATSTNKDSVLSAAESLFKK